MFILKNSVSFKLQLHPQSHSHHSAFWDGECALDEAEKSIYYFRTFVDLTDESALCDAIDDVAI